MWELVASLLNAQPRAPLANKERDKANGPKNRGRGQLLGYLYNSV